MTTYTNNMHKSQVRDQLASKFGKEFMMQAMENEDERVNPKVRC